MLKICLQVLVCLLLAMRMAAVFGHLRRAWLGDSRREPGLAAQFRQELRRRGLVLTLPIAEIDGNA